jgi:hypothetical protein
MYKGLEEHGDVLGFCKLTSVTSRRLYVFRGVWGFLRATCNP